MDGTGILYHMFISDHDNSSSLIHRINLMSYNNPNIFTACAGTGPYVFVGNGDFSISVYATSSNHGLKCDGSDGGKYMSNIMVHSTFIATANFFVHHQLIC